MDLFMLVNIADISEEHNEEILWKNKDFGFIPKSSKLLFQVHFWFL